MITRTRKADTTVYEYRGHTYTLTLVRSKHNWYAAWRGRNNRSHMGNPRASRGEAIESTQKQIREARS